MQWLDKHYPNIFDEVHFVTNEAIDIDENWNDNTKKSIICQNLWVDVMIEDNPDYANDVAVCWVKTFLIKKPWNMWRKLHSNIIVVDSFYEINI